ncbi:NAC domain-containing protein 83-like [Impatiens glandulifera]|uniref:NAC domain-containing protein 83-like n=1 Tax=Impatiens glandulifera TaxID=253017 RepID=UPI001FB0A6AA|nr:NAC domain-containing protein 83-like [Impatiens glandulifera]
MDSKLNFVKDGALHLPPGFRFQPTEEEIVFQYLTRKTYSHPLPASVIPEINNIRNFNPWDLPGDQEQDRYFFSNASEVATSYKKRNKSKGSVGSGYWKTTGIEKKIDYVGKKQYPIMGMRRTFIFHGGRKTGDEWFMHEYRLSDSKTQLGNWVLCHVFIKQTSINENDNDENTILSDENESNGVYDLHTNFMAKTPYVTPTSPTSSCSSSSRGNHMIADVTSHAKYFVDDQDESSSCGHGPHGYDHSSTFGDY